MVLFIIVLLLIGFFTLYEYKEKFITFGPPQLEKQDVHWANTYAEKSNLRDNVLYKNVFANTFPSKKPPSLIESTEEGDIDVTRSQFLPRMAIHNTN